MHYLTLTFARFLQNLRIAAKNRTKNACILQNYSFSIRELNVLVLVFVS